MSAAAALLLAVMPVAAPPAPAVAEEIVVIGRKLADWRGIWKSRKGVLSCKTTRSTGDKAIDAVGCQALIACTTPLVPQFQAIAGAKLAKAERDARMNTLAQSIGPCLVERRADGIAALADARAGG